jgi:hypothetical protein
MFGVLKGRLGAAELIAEGNFHNAIERYGAKGGITWTRTIADGNPAEA